MRIHCIPIGDERLHCAQLTCWCHPLLNSEPVEGGYICIHNAKDCREAFERQDYDNYGGWINIGEELGSAAETVKG